MLIAVAAFGNYLLYFEKEVLTFSFFCIILQLQRLNKYLIDKSKNKEENSMKKTYKIEVDCANCANLMEDAARKTAGPCGKEAGTEDHTAGEYYSASGAYCSARAGERAGC